MPLSVISAVVNRTLRRAWPMSRCRSSGWLRRRDGARAGPHRGPRAGPVRPTSPRADGVVEVPVTVTDPEPGRQRAATAVVGDQRLDFAFTDAEPGWTMFMVSHFHYDPVWWNTQAAYTSEWTENPPGRARQTNGFELVQRPPRNGPPRPGIQVRARRGRLPQAVLGHPSRGPRRPAPARSPQGRVEIMGGTYNEPNTNLTGPETAIRNFVHGIGFQRHVMGADPATAWQLDVFGHDPQFPGMAADAGLTSSSWARGPHHQWGPMAGDGDPERHAVRQRVRVDRTVGGRPADPLHARALFGRLVDGLGGDAAGGRERHLRAVRRTEEGDAHPQRAAAGRHRLHATQQVGHRDSPRLELPATRGRDSCARCPGSSSPRSVPNSPSAGWRRRRRPAT